MSDEGYKPVKLDTKKALAKAQQRTGFAQAWDALEEEYARLNPCGRNRRFTGSDEVPVNLKQKT